MLLVATIKNVKNIYNLLRGKWDKLTQYQSPTSDMSAILQQQQDFLVAKFLSGLNDKYNVARS